MRSELSSIAIKYTLIDTVVSDCVPFPIFKHTTGMTHFLDSSNEVFWHYLCCVSPVRYHVSENITLRVVPVCCSLALCTPGN